MSFFFGFTCTCGNELEADIEVDYGGSRGNTYGPPEFCFPAEGGEWHMVKPVTCEDDTWVTGPNAGQVAKGCGKVWDNEDLAARFEDDIQRRIAEPPDPPDEY
jgi:hypothetical protein